MKCATRTIAMWLATFALVGLAATLPCAKGAETPAASVRSNASNFKDMVLAVCISRSQQGETAADAAGSARALVEWTLYDAEKGTDEIDRLVNRFLDRNYHNPLGGDEGDGTQFNLLKCLDLYHSTDLESLSKRVVLQPRRRKR